MKFFGKTAVLAVVSLFFLVLQAQAMTITFGGTEAFQDIGAGLVDAGLTADKVGIDANTNTADTASGWYIETFDKNDGQGNFTGGFTTLDQSKLTITGGIAFQNGSTTNVAAAPAKDNTFFAFTPEPGGVLPASVYVPNSAYYAYDPANPKYIDYMGLYFGSIDTYNSIEFYYSGGSYELTGTEILSSYYDGLGINYTGSWTDPASNVYVNLDFDLGAGEIFTAFELKTTGVALELDNIVTHVSSVPEPATMFLFGIGLLGLARVSRKK